MGLDVVERPCVPNWILNLQQLGFPCYVLVSVAGVRVVAQPLRTAWSTLLLDRLERVRHVTRIVAGARHDVRPLDIGLLFKFPAESKEGCAQPEARCLSHDRTD